MVSYVRLPAKVSEDGAGNVYADIVVANQNDIDHAEDGSLHHRSIRRIALDRVLVDTGATTLSLPLSAIERLGLRRQRTLMAETANGIVETEIFRGAALEVLGRTATVECLALPEGSRPLLGVIPLEMLGLPPNLVTHELDVLPDNGPGTYIYI